MTPEHAHDHHAPSRPRSETPKADWLFAMLCAFGGATLTVLTWAMASGMAASLSASGAGDIAANLVALAGVTIAVVVACRLPRRARALWVTGLLTPVVIAAAFLAWVLWAFSHSNFTF